jgi:Zn-dependent peptidase ImmA (M78 family)
MLFTLAHELGHVLAHHREPRSAIFDLASQIGGSRHHNKSEAFADAFASVLLMPEQGVAIALREIRSTLGVHNESIGDVEILYLARFYGVSFEVAARRCEDLELLPPGGAYSLTDHLKKTHGNAEKLAAALGLRSRTDVFFPRVSHNVLRAAASKIEEGKVSLGWVTDHLGSSISEIYASRAALGGQRGNRH